MAKAPHPPNLRPARCCFTCARADFGDYYGRPSICWRESDSGAHVHVEPILVCDEYEDKLARPKAVVQVGQVVDYHSIIGGPITSRKHTITKIGNLHGVPVAWITGGSGCVAIEALTPHRDE